MNGVRQKCGENKELIHRHVKYAVGANPEIVIMVCKSCHKKIHNQVRKENKCPFSPEEVRTLTHKSGAAKTVRSDYCKKYVRSINFYETMMKNVQFVENIFYNERTGNVRAQGRFLICNTPPSQNIQDREPEVM